MERLRTLPVQTDPTTRERVFPAAVGAIEDARFVIHCAHLHPDAAEVLQRARDTLEASNGTDVAAIAEALLLVRGVPRMLVLRGASPTARPACTSLPRCAHRPAAGRGGRS